MEDIIRHAETDLWRGGGNDRIGGGGRDVCPVEQQALGMNSSNSSTGEQDLDSSSKGTGAQKSIVNRRSWERNRKKKKKGKHDLKSEKKAFFEGKEKEREKTREINKAISGLKKRK
jgi:hypothetical protein